MSIVTDTIRLKPTDQVIVGATSVALVYGIFANCTPNYADVRADVKGNANTHASIKTATVTSIAAVGTLSLVAKSPTVFTIGGLMILFEAWKFNYANHAKDGTRDNMTQAG